jgi:hypothetical protein
MILPLVLLQCLSRISEAMRSQEAETVPHCLCNENILKSPEGAQKMRTLDFSVGFVTPL